MAKSVAIIKPCRQLVNFWEDVKVKNLLCWKLFGVKLGFLMVKMEIQKRGWLTTSGFRGHQG